MIPIARSAALPHTRAPEIDHPELVLVRARDGISIRDLSDTGEGPARELTVKALFFLLSPLGEPGQHLRLLGHLATHIDDDAFLDQWLAAKDEDAIRTTLLREERSITLHLTPGSPFADWAGKPIHELTLRPDVLIALIRRGGRSFVPRGSIVLESGDRLTIIGEPEAIRSLAEGP